MHKYITCTNMPVNIYTHRTRTLRVIHAQIHNMCRDASQHTYVYIHIHIHKGKKHRATNATNQFLVAMHEIHNVCSRLRKGRSLQALVEILRKSNKSFHARSKLWWSRHQRQHLKAGWQDHLPSRAYIQKPKRQCWQANWTCHLPETPVEILTNRQSWKTTWQCHSLQALVEANTKHQDVKTGWQSFGGSKLCLTWNLKTKRQCLQTAWNVTCSKLWWLWWKFWNSQCLKTTWQCHSLQAKLWCKVNTPKVTVWRMVGKNTRSKLGSARSGNQTYKFQDPLGGSLAPSSGWHDYQKPKFERC